MKHPRATTIKLLEMMDEGTLDPRTVANIALDYLSEAEVADMAERNDLLTVFDEDDDQIYG